MSFFMDSEQVHITSSIQPASVMAGPPVADTVLHNDKLFLGYDLHAVSVSSHTYRATPYSPVIYYRAIVHASTSLMSSAEISYLLKADKTHTYVNQFLSRIPGANNQDSWPSSPTQSSTYHIPIVARYNGYPAIPDISYIVLINSRKLINGTGVLIRGTKGGTPSIFQIGDLDIGNIKYVSPGQVISHSGSPVIDGYYQLVDASAITGSIEIQSDSLAGTLIKKGGHTIIDGSVGLFSGTSVTTTYSTAISPNSKTLIFVAVLNDVHRVTSSGGIKTAVINGSTFKTVIGVSIDYFWGGSQWLPIQTTIYYTVEGLSIYIEAVTTHLYASSAEVPSPFNTSIEVFSEA